MTDLRRIPEDELMALAQQWRREALHVSKDARGMAHFYESELQRRRKGETGVVMSVDAQFTVLQLSDHGNARREDCLYGGWHRRFLNVTGRWSAAAIKEAPLIAWPDEGTAAQAVNIASQARGRDVSVFSIGPESIG